MKSYILQLLLAACVSVPTFAQWTKVADRVVGDFPGSCCGFGHITFSDGRVWAGRETLYVSEDTGKTWTQLQTFIGTISQIDFFDKLTGIVATTSGVYQTSDGGLNWLAILLRADCYSAEYCGTKDNIVALADNGGLFYSTTGGISWTSANPNGHPHFTLANDDGSAFIFSDGGGGVMLLTSDQGATYDPRPGLDGDCFFAARDSSRAIYVVNEGGHVDQDGKGTIYKSTDEGNTWKELTTKGIQYYSAGITASTCALFVQTTGNGIERSIDGGETWINIDGPSNAIDTRTVCAVNNNIVFAVDQGGSIWRTLNSGGVPISAQTDSLRISTPHAAINSVANAQIQVPITVTRARVGTGFTMVVHYDTLAFIYEGTFANGDRIDVPAQTWPGRALVAFRDADVTSDSGMIGFSVFRIKWFEPFCHEVLFDSVLAATSACTNGILLSSSKTIVGNYPGCALSAPNATDSQGISIRPNPSIGVFSVHTTGIMANVSVHVVDLLGRVMFEQAGLLGGEHPLSIDIKHVPAGTYYLRLQQGNNVKTFPVIKE